MARGRELDVLTGAESRAPYRTMRDDLGRIAAGWYVAELADRFTVDHAPSAPVFDLVETALRHLEAGHVPALVCRWFDLHLLDRSGFRPELGRCVQCEGVLQETVNVWSPQAGGVICHGCLRSPEHAGAPLSVRALKSLRFLLVSDFAAAIRLRVDAPLAAELERSLRGFLHVVLERDVQAARLIDEIRDLPAARGAAALPRLPAEA
jgi:DNA repair protein RecO (recombination protein O)